MYNLSVGHRKKVNILPNESSPGSPGRPTNPKSPAK